VNAQIAKLQDKGKVNKAESEQPSKKRQFHGFTQRFLARAGNQ